MAAKTGRHACVRLSYTRGKKAAAGDRKEKSARTMREYMESFSYTDCAHGNFDTVNVVLNNSDFRFCRDWMPKKKDRMSAAIVTWDWNSNERKKRMRCGMFMVDDVKFSGVPSICEIGGICAPETSSFRTAERDKSWKKATLKSVARAIAGKYKLGLKFIGADVNIGTTEQSGETDCDFLCKTAEEYGYGMKLYRSKILIYDRASLEKAKPAGTIHKYQVVGGYDWSTSMTGTYTGAKIRYANEKDKEVTCTVGKGPRWLRVSGEADNITQAKKIALAAVNKANEETISLTLTIRGSTRYYATATAMVQGFGRMSGKYFIDEAEHTVDTSGGYTTRLVMHKVLKRITA